MRREWISCGVSIVAACLLSAVLMVGCTPGHRPAAQVSDPQEPAGVTDPQPAQPEPEKNSLAEVEALVGQPDAEVSDRLGGGTKNWTEDGKTYIGQIYHTELYGEPVVVYTSCGPEGNVDALSVWIRDGEQPTETAVVQDWQIRISEHTQVEMVTAPVSAESGTQSWYWQTEDYRYTLQLLEDILTLQVNPAVGELQ